MTETNTITHIYKYKKYKHKSKKFSEEIMLWEDGERWSDADPVYTPSINASHFPLSPLIIIIIVVIIIIIIIIV